MFGLSLFRRDATPANPPAAVDRSCFHCGLPLPATVADWVAFDGDERPMCCAACAEAARWVIGLGRGDWYRGQARG